jgi:hypothetical protein
LEPSRWDSKIPLLGLCILSAETERMGLPGLRARLLKDKFKRY